MLLGSSLTAPASSDSSELSWLSSTGVWAEMRRYLSLEALTKARLQTADPATEPTTIMTIKEVPDALNTARA